MFFQIDQNSTVAASCKAMEEILTDMLRAIRRYRTGSDDEVFHLLITSSEIGENAHSEVGIDRFDAHIGTKVRIYTAPLD